MRKWAWVPVITVTAWLGLAAAASAREEVQSISVAYRNIGIKVDGQAVTTESEPFIVVGEGRAYVPARVLAEALGARVGWDAATNTVRVYTPRYVETSTAGSLTTYRLPYWGISIQLPPHGLMRPAESPKSALLEVKLGDAGVMVDHMASVPSLTLDAEAGFFLQGMQTAIPDLTVSNEHPVAVPGASGAIDATCAGSVAGERMGFRFRLINAGTDLWIVAVMYPQASAAAAGPIVDQAFASFQFPTGTGS